MTDDERDRLMDRLENLDQAIRCTEIEEYDLGCWCDEDECDVCAVREGLRHNLDELRRTRESILNRFPEVRYDSSGTNC